MSETYYIKDGIVYSSTSQQIEHTAMDHEINIGDQSVKDLIEILEKIKNEKRKITINGPLENPDIITQLEQNKTENKGFKEAQEDDYEFVGKTSTLLILNQILKGNADEDKIKTQKKYIIDHIKSHKNSEDQKLDGIKKEVNAKKKDISSKSKDIAMFEKQNITPSQKKIDTANEKLKRLEIDKATYSQELDSYSQPPANESEHITQTREKVRKLQDKLEDSELEIKIVQKKVMTLEEKKKAGILKSPSIFPMIFTLGLIYWTGYSDTQYQINKLKIKIAQKKEKIQKLEMDLNKLEREVSRYEEKNKLDAVSIAKRVERLKSMLEEIEIKINSSNKIIEKATKEMEGALAKKDKFDEDIRKDEEALASLEEMKNMIVSNSGERVKELMKEIEEDHKKEMEQIKKIKEMIQSQTTTIQGSWVVTFEQLPSQ